MKVKLVEGIENWCLHLNLTKTLIERQITQMFLQANKQLPHQIDIYNFLYNFLCLCGSVHYVLAGQCFSSTKFSFLEKLRSPLEEYLSQLLVIIRMMGMSFVQEQITFKFVVIIRSHFWQRYTSSFGAKRSQKRNKTQFCQF